MTFAVRALPVGRTEIPGPELFWMGEWDRWFPLSFNVVASDAFYYYENVEDGRMLGINCAGGAVAGE